MAGLKLYVITKFDNSRFFLNIKSPFLVEIQPVFFADVEAMCQS
jgi:hypothetical protein